MNRKSNYSFCEKIYMGICWCRMRWISSTARLIRFPFVIRGKQYVDFGNKLTTGRNCRIDVLGTHNKRVLSFGDNVNLGDNVRISCVTGIKIGSNVLIGSRVLIIDNSHGTYSGDNQDSPYIPPNERELISKPIVIEDNVWIGEGCVIQQGVTIGYGSIIAANSVVTKNVEPKTMVGGNTAIVLKKYDEVQRKWIRL